MIRLMGPEDQRNYGPGIHPEDDSHPPSKTDRLEREEQRQFANWLMLKGLFKATVWHKTNARTGSTLGTPDFIVPVNCSTLFIEFKRAGYGLSKDQEEFKAGLEEQGKRLYVVYSALEAIELTRYFMPLSAISNDR
jgi:hypothetical protein